MNGEIRGAHAPRVHAMAPSPWHALFQLIQTEVQQDKFRRGAEMGTRGACAPRTGLASRTSKSSMND
jgi:hypothetical protein